MTDPPEIDLAAPTRQAPPAPMWAGPLSGLLAGAAAICTGLVVAAIMDVDSPLNAVGSEFIDHTPKWLKDFAVDAFGTNDKLALRTGMVSVIAVLSLVVGALARRRPVVGPAAMVAFGAIGAFVAAGRPNQSVSAAVPALLGAVTGSAVVWYLIRFVRGNDGAREMPTTPTRARNGFDRRRFVTTSGAVRGRRGGRRGHRTQARERSHRPHPQRRARRPARGG